MPLGDASDDGRVGVVLDAMDSVSLGGGATLLGIIVGFLLPLCS